MQEQRVVIRVEACGAYPPERTPGLDPKFRSSRTLAVNLSLNSNSETDRHLWPAGIG